jgi:hypothetical protein
VRVPGAVLTAAQDLLPPVENMPEDAPLPRLVTLHSRALLSGVGALGRV